MRLFFVWCSVAAAALRTPGDRFLRFRGAVSAATTRISTVGREGRETMRRPRSLVAVAAGAEVVEGGGAATPAMKAWRTQLLFAALVAQKVAADTLTGYTRQQATYSGATVSMLSEVAKFPVLAVAICAFGGGFARIGSTLKGAWTLQPFSMAWIAGAYAAQNVLYFVALGHISAASYQVLSQSKLIFTALLTVTMLRQRLSVKQLGSLFALLCGSLLVQLSEMTGAGGLAGSKTALFGGAMAILGALLSALPNVWYEKLLKTEGEDEWVRNVQVTFWIFAWIALAQLKSYAGPARDLLNPSVALSALFGGPKGFDGITPLVWLVIALKSLNGILIPMTLKYAGNLVYLYAKPTAIVTTALATALVTGVVPPLSFVGGAALVIFSMLTFSSRPKKEDKATN